MILRLVAVLGAAAFLFAVRLVAAPSPAQAFIGESLVIDAAGALTGPAETVLESPTFLTENVGEAAALGGSGEASGAAAVFEAAGVLPALGSVLAFGAGVGVGSEICHVLGIEGCWFFGATAEPPPVAQLHWFWIEHFVFAGQSFDYTWVSGKGVSGPYFVDGVNGVPEGCTGNQPPAGWSRRALGAQRSITCPVGGSVVAGETLYSRDAMADRQLAYHATDDPSIPDYEPGGKPYEASSEWPQKLAAAIKGHDGDAAARVGQFLASRISGSGVADPYAMEGAVPNCGGLTYAQCGALLEAEGLEPVRNTLGWQAADLGTAADLVVRTEPAAGRSVPLKSSVTVTVNPPAAGMPVVVPSWESHETYSHYAARLPSALVPHRREVGEANEDLEAGPEAVLGTSPQPGSRADPSAETDLDVRTNPITAPAPGSGAGTCSAGVSAIDWSPLNQPLGSRFPFGVFGFFGGWISSWEAGSPSVPDWNLTILPAGVFGSQQGLHVHVDLAFMAPVVSVVRVVFLFAAFVGLLWFLATAAASLQGDSS